MFPRTFQDLLSSGSGGRVDFLGRRSDLGMLDRASHAMASGLVNQGIRPGDYVALFMPNCPTVLVGLFAASSVGALTLLLDPRDPVEDVEALLRAHDPKLILTLDPAPLFDRLLQVLACCPGAQVAVGRFTDLLPFPRNLLVPLMRGNALASIPPDRRFLRLSQMGRAPLPPPGQKTEIILPQTRLAEPALLARAQRSVGRHLPKRMLLGRPLADRSALTQVLGILGCGGEVLLSPRLDRQSLQKVARQAGVTAVLD